tara:strand:+ start:236 stop:586 length:351 start_codon:yes stop_codon:yes gene_type:complete
MRIGKFFLREEFACNCNCGFDTVDTELITILDKVRMHFAKPVTITSGCRCPEYNGKVGGALRSQHVLGRAADIQVKDTDPADVAAYLEDIQAPGVGRYNTFTHVDSRSSRGARWKG